MITFFKSLIDRRLLFVRNLPNPYLYNDYNRLNSIFENLTEFNM